MEKIIVTGGLGFIGSYFVELALARGYEVINIDKKTYAARTDLNFDVHPHYHFQEADICTLEHLPPGVRFLVNFAAESHVDNSITANDVFFHSNVGGVYNLLELVRAKEESDRPLFVQISTDEVYGSLPQGQATEHSCLHPSSPYSATKAAADQLIHAWQKTYGVHYLICRSCNNYGFGQYPEKLFAKTIDHLANGKKMTVHGNGSYTREWLYAGDNCEAILLAMEKGNRNEIYNISSNEERSVIAVVEMIAKAMKPGDEWQKWVEFVQNRQGQDGRYAVDTTKIRNLGWKPTMKIEDYIPQYLRLYAARS